MLGKKVFTIYMNKYWLFQSTISEGVTVANYLETTPGVSKSIIFTGKPTSLEKGFNFQEKKKSFYQISKLWYKM